MIVRIVRASGVIGFRQSVERIVIVIDDRSAVARQRRGRSVGAEVGRRVVLFNNPSD